MHSVVLLPVTRDVICAAAAHPSCMIDISEELSQNQLFLPASHFA